jgi:hypothetical protein
MAILGAVELVGLAVDQPASGQSSGPWVPPVWLSTRRKMEIDAPQGRRLSPSEGRTMP